MALSTKYVLWLNFGFIRGAEYTGKLYLILSSYFEENAGKRTLKQKGEQFILKEFV